MNDIQQSKPKPLTTLPQIPLRSNASLEEQFLAKIEHRQVNQAFINRLKQEQASNQWIQDLKQAITFPDMQITPTQKWASANLLVEIDGILIRCAERATGRNTTLKRVDTILVPQSMRSELLEMLHNHPAHGHRGRICRPLFLDRNGKGYSPVHSRM